MAPEYHDGQIVTSTETQSTQAEEDRHAGTIERVLNNRHRVFLGGHYTFILTIAAGSLTVGIRCLGRTCTIILIATLNPKPLSFYWDAVTKFALPGT